MRARSSTTIYDAASRSIAEIDALDNRGTTVYDSAGRTVASIDPLGARATAVYDAAGQTVASVNPLGARSSSVYNAAGQTVAAVDPLGNRNTSVYDAAGRVVGRIDALDNRSTSVYDAVGRPIAVVNATDDRATSVYDQAGRQVARVDANANRTTSVYDAAGRTTTQADPLDRRVTYSYNGAGRLTLKHDARGARITMSYDDAGQLLGQRYPDGDRYTYTYDSVGARTLMADPTGRATYTYDARNAMVSATDPADKTITYAYDALGRRATMSDPDGGLFTYSYDDAGRLDYLINPLAERTTWTYDNANRTTQKALANGAKATYTYDAANRVTRAADVTSGGTMISSFDYAYDNVGNRTSVIEANGDRVTWSYDKTYELTREQRSGANARDVTHTYDSVGNRLLQQDSAALTTYSYDAANQLDTSQDASGVTTFTYDASGNLQLQEAPAGARTTNTWDADNRLTLVEAPSNVVNTMTYNAAGLRALKEDSAGVSKFIWDGQKILLETDAADTSQAKYTLQPDGFGSLISQRRGADSHFFHFDALGSTAALTNASQASTDTYLYKAFGDILAATGSTVNPFRFVGDLGYYYDFDLLQYYIRARHYDPGLARWLSVDPIGFEGGDGNLFRYVGNRPLFGSDPSGLLIALPAPPVGRPPVPVWMPTLEYLNLLLSGIGAAYLQTCACAGGFSWTGGALQAVINPGATSTASNWPWTHCMFNCSIVAECGGGRKARRCAASLSLAKELADMILCQMDGYTATPACESAMQRADFLDNAMGRDFGAECFLTTLLSRGAPSASRQCCCMKKCNTYAPLGGVGEGPGTLRPFGPYHPTPGMWPFKTEFFDNLPSSLWGILW